MSAGHHVISGYRGEWRVRNTGAARAARVFTSREDAIAFARELARREGGEVFVHNEDGTVRDHRTYERRAG
ncbi:DUF2188 domain-containing protein [Brevundimonas sp.]|uniref:DUF2188 domain-containing protein n=1 Tax=Brevundimonas sp. TaxID=1871086 RepID=UPI00356AEFD6